MGSRGPLQKPTSIRGERARKRGVKKRTETTPERPVMPGWLPEGLSDAWAAVVSDLEAAGVPLQRIDSRAIGLYVLCVSEAAKAATAGDLKLSARLGRDCLQWAAAIGATPAARARLNIKPEKRQDPDDPWARFE